MRRRDLLASVMGTVANRFASPLRALDEAQLDVRVEDVTGASGRDLGFEVERLSSFSRRSPAELAITVRNDGDEERTALLPTPGQPFGYTFPEAPDSGLVLLPHDSTTIRTLGSGPSEHADAADRFPPRAPTGGCWRLRRSPIRAFSTDIVDLGPGADVTGTCSVVGSARSDSCPEPGTYRFLAPTPFGTGDRLGFTLRLE